MPVDVAPQRQILVTEQIDATVAQQVALVNCPFQPLGVSLCNEFDGVLPVLSSGVKASRRPMEQISFQRRTVTVNERIELGIVIDSEAGAHSESVGLAPDLLAQAMHDLGLRHGT